MAAVCPAGPEPMITYIVTHLSPSGTVCKKTIVRTTFECSLLLLGTLVGGMLVGAILVGEAAEENLVVVRRGIALKRVGKRRLDGLSLTDEQATYTHAKLLNKHALKFR